MAVGTASIGPIKGVIVDGQLVALQTQDIDDPVFDLVGERRQTRLITPGRRIMAAPPAVTVVSTIAPSIPSSFDVGPTDTRVLSNTALTLQTGWFNDGGVPSSVWGDATNTPANRQPGGPQMHSIICDGDKVAVKVVGFQGVPKLQIKVDGEYIQAAAWDVPNTSAYTWYVIPFPDRKARTVTALLFGDTCMFAGFTVPTNAAVHDMPYQRRDLLLGDSYVWGDSLKVPGDTLAIQFAEKIGSLNVWPSGVGGSGILTPAPGGAPAAVGRLDADVVPFMRAGDRLWVAMGTNDWGSGKSSTTAQGIRSLIRTIRQKLPGITLKVLTPWRPRSGANANNAFDDEFKAAVQAEGVECVDVRRLFTGTGRVGATANNGNSDVCINTDNTHPTQIGADVAATALSLYA
jgi:hypothetical protein